MGAFGGPDIITSNLIHAFDAGSTRSYPASGGTTAYDLAGTDNGTLYNGVAFNSINGGCWEFDGINDYIDVQGASETQTSTGSFEAWIYPVTGGQGDQIFCGIGGGSTVGASRTVRIINNDWAFVGYGSSNEDWSGIADVVYSAWSHILFTWNGTALTYWVNGVKYTATRTGLVTPNSSVIRLGVSPWNATDREFVGKIALSRFYNIVLSDSQVLQNYNAQKNRFI
tara:strand:- start:259 stop:936 length:678 start_codon:yes stop_codon:yes gene_type:complete